LAAFAGAKEKARRTACKNGLRQLSLALRMYGDDFQNACPAAHPTRPCPRPTIICR
jgi:hypothetical protein